MGSLLMLLVAVPVLALFGAPHMGWGSAIVGDSGGALMKET